MNVSNRRTSRVVDQLRKWGLQPVIGTYRPPNIGRLSDENFDYLSP
jgi:hypothetical protein